MDIKVNQVVQPTQVNDTNQTNAPTDDAFRFTLGLLCCFRSCSLLSLGLSLTLGLLLCALLCFFLRLLLCGFSSRIYFKSLLNGLIPALGTFIQTDDDLASGLL